MADGDQLTLGVANSATSMTRLIGRVDENFALMVDQEGTGGLAIWTNGKIHAIGIDLRGTGVEGQGGTGLPGEPGGVIPRHHGQLIEVRGQRPAGRRHAQPILPRKQPPSAVAFCPWI